MDTKNQNISQKSGSFSFLPKSPYLLAYLVIFMVLWDTKGMTNPKDPSFPFSTVFLTLVFIGLIVSLFIKRKTKDVANIHVLGLFLLIQLVLFFVGNFSTHHYLYTYTRETSHLFLFNSLFYLSCGLFILIFLIKKYSLILSRALLGVSILFSFTVIYCSIDSAIDTHLFLNMASDYFLQFKNPYNYNYPDIYNGEFTDVYGDKYYFNYWPFPLYVCSMFRFAFGDVRYAFVLAQLIFVFIMIRNRNLLSLQKVILIALLWLFNLTVLYVNERSWIDALVAPFFISSILLMQNRKFFWAAILVGLMASIKLYYIFALPFFGLYYLREKKIKEIFMMGVAFIATFLPFAILSFDNLYNSTIVFINSTKIREDSLSWISAMKRLFDIDASFGGMLLMFALMGLFILLYWRGKNNILNLVKYINLTFFAIFLLSKQSFCNYFYFNMLCCLVIFYLESNFHFGDTKLPANGSVTGGN